MADQRIQATENMIGANHPTLTDTLNRLTLVEHNTDGTHHNITIDGTIVQSLTTDSSSSTTGAMKTAGGLGVAKNANVGGSLGVIGITAIADGTAAAPSLSFTSDPDSGIYRIGANNIGIAVNGTKALDIKSTGLNVTGALEIASDLGIINSAAKWNLVGDETPLSATYTSGTALAGIYSVVENIGGFAGLSFKTQDAGGTGYTSRLYITHAGNVLIGTTTDAGTGKLQVAGTTASTDFNWVGSSVTTSATAGSASALPALPVGYLRIYVDGEVRRIPIYL